MGGGSWSSDSYRSSVTARASKGIRDFDYDHKVKTGVVSGIHADLDPRKVAGPTSPVAGKPIRESRDSVEHPNSLPIAMLFDVTGSMGAIPTMLQKKLTSLMDVVIAKTGIPDPQILVGAIGDSTCDKYPFQVGQFESDNRFDEALRNTILEGGGGGQNKESYALAYRFGAYHTATDSWEKRGKKGYLITMGDEMPWPTVTAADVQRIFGVPAEADESIEQLLAKAQERWDIFHIHANDGQYPNHTTILGRWRELLGERLVIIEDSSLACEVVAGLIYMLESSYDVDKVVGDIGLSGKAATDVKNALVPLSKASVPAHMAKGGLPGSHGKGSGGVTTV